jgi:hypothetical protein
VGYGVNPQIRHLRTKEVLGVLPVREKRHEDPPIWSPICLHPFPRLGEKIKGAYMPSWVLLSMKDVEERVRERKTKL